MTPAGQFLLIRVETLRSGGPTSRWLPAQTLSGFEPKRPLNQAQTRTRRDGENTGKTVEGHLVEENRGPHGGSWFPPTVGRQSRAPRTTLAAGWPPVSWTPRTAGREPVSRPHGGQAPGPLQAADPEPTLFRRGRALTQPPRMSPAAERPGQWAGPGIILKPR